MCLRPPFGSFKALDTCSIIGKDQHPCVFLELKPIHSQNDDSHKVLMMSFPLDAYRRVRMHYNQEGHTFDEAKAQVTSSAIRNQAVQNAAWNAATSGRA